MKVEVSKPKQVGAKLAEGSGLDVPEAPGQEKPPESERPPVNGLDGTRSDHERKMGERGHGEGKQSAPPSSSNTPRAGGASATRMSNMGGGPGRGGDIHAKDPAIPEGRAERIAAGALNEGASGSDRHIDFSLSNQLPAVFTKPDESVSMRAESPAQAAAAETLLDDFLDEVETEPDAPLEVKDAKWTSAAQLSDERFRSLFGQEAFLRQSLDSARLTKSIPASRKAK